MRRSDDRILATHVGSLPRPDDLLPFLKRLQAGEDVAGEEFETAVREATETVVRRQAEAGIDIASHGEQGRLAFVLYVVDRLTGFDGETPAIQWADLEEFPDFARQVPTFGDWSRPDTKIPAATGPITYAGADATDREIDRFDAAIDTVGAEFEDRFVTAASPGTVASYLGNEYFDTHEEYVFAVAEAMREEYERLAETGAVLQIDSPDLLGGRHLKFKEYTDAEFVEVVRTHIDALNEALSDVPAEQVRLHTCWGNYEGPHHHDIPLETVLPELYEADIGALLLEEANPCHQHDYKLFREYPLPDDWLLVPGVIDVTVNYIEPPEVIADRIERVATAVGDPTRIVAGADCGLGTFAGFGAVDPDIAWRKLDALADGAAVASDRLF